MTLAFIRQVEDCLHHLENLETRADNDDSAFRYTISSARASIKQVADAYHEVIRRDASEDEAYIPPLMEVK